MQFSPGDNYSPFTLLLTLSHTLSLHPLRRRNI
jgi:hypothetical protein